ncbi:ribosomal protein L1 [Gonapodya prolifera JEL478]|uniref:Ribosomal L1 domain-containing protein 1 n=1 Tax=Gonapodya prolifera (strain JEL478) TaxID=1344416 RepID=A0A139A4K7_GONPJ|nr:ribosomal protein L1 [Gonapodya prolifera JEL478]|eukprot:KXS11654.1 ribosomal protein L1 [Gonapodya prolifera JEL478]
MSQSHRALDPTQVERSTKALLAWFNKSKSTEESSELALIPENQSVWVVVSTRTIPDNFKIKPVRITIPHPFLPPTASVCLITKDPQREYKDKLDATPGGEARKLVNKVIDVSKLRAKYKPFEAKRQLCREYDLFLADERVLPLLPKILGKKFFEAKKHPVPVNLTKTDLLGEIKGARSSTYLHLNRGNCTSIRVGLTSQTAEELAANILTVLDTVITNYVPRKWSNVQSIHVKTSESVALPIYNSLPEEKMVIEVKPQVTKERTKRKREETEVDEQKKVEKKARNEDAAEEEVPKKGSEKKASKKGVKEASKEAVVEDKQSKSLGLLAKEKKDKPTSGASASEKPSRNKAGAVEAPKGSKAKKIVKAK